MALWSARVEIVKRGDRAGGRSVVACAAYRAGERLHDARTGQTFDYTNRRDVQWRGMMVPDGSPDWAHDRQEYWNRVEATERRKDAQLARSLRIALPRELDAPSRIALVQDFVRSAFVSRGMVVDVAVHNPQASDGQEQPHAHLLIGMRPVNADGTGFEGKTKGSKARAWNSHELYDEQLAEWEGRCNQALERAGSASRVDRRSLAEQRQEAIEQGDLVRAQQLTRQPEPYLGFALRFKDLSQRMQRRVDQWKAARFRRNALQVLDGLRAGGGQQIAETVRRAEAFAQQQAQVIERTSWRHTITQGPDYDIER